MADSSLGLGGTVMAGCLLERLRTWGLLRLGSRMLHQSPCRLKAWTMPSDALVFGPRGKENKLCCHVSTATEEAKAGKQMGPLSQPLYS